MATQQLDLEEQEQLDKLKDFWRKWGNAITWVVIALLSGYAAFNGWQFWQNKQAQKAGAIYDQVTQAVAAEDVPRLTRVVGDFRNEASASILLQHSELALAKLAADNGDYAVAAAALDRVIADGHDEGLTAVATLRLAGVYMQQGAMDKAKALLAGEWAVAFQGLVSDRLGDIAMAASDKEAALAAYQQAWATLSEDAAYRRLVEVKLNALGAVAGVSGVVGAQTK